MTWALLTVLAAPPDFATIERNKFEAFAQATQFQGTYQVVAAPTEGTAVRQDVELALGEAGRKIRVFLGQRLIYESAWTKDRKWVADHQRQAYTLVDAPGQIPLTEPYRALAAPANNLNFIVNDLGPRFAADPMPVVQSEAAGTVDGKRVRTVTAVSNNATTGGQVRLVQHFDEGTWIVRRFEITVSAAGKVSATITGFLRDDKRGPVAFGTFQLPSEVSQKYRRVQTGSSRGGG